jgi:hypothetical protein
MDQQTDIGIVPLRLEYMSDQVVRVDVVHSRSNRIGVNLLKKR